MEGILNSVKFFLSLFHTEEKYIKISLTKYNEEIIVIGCVHLHSVYSDMVT
jgi:hypothetical protein